MAHGISKINMCGVGTKAKAISIGVMPKHNMRSKNNENFKCQSSKATLAEIDLLRPTTTNQPNTSDTGINYVNQAN